MVKEAFLDGESAIAALSNHLDGSELDVKGMYILQLINYFIQNGSRIYQRCPQGSFRGLPKGGRRNVQASALCRAKGTADDRAHEASLPSSYSPEQEIIARWAIRDGCWSDYPETDLVSSGKKHKDFLDGSESRIFYDGSDKVFKTIDHVRYGSLQCLLDRITIHNHLFPETAMHVEGFGVRDYAEDNSGFCVVISQPFIQGQAPSFEEIEKSLLSRGVVKKDNTGIFFSPEHDYLIADVRPNNALKTSEGNIFIFDCEAWINAKIHVIPPLSFSDISLTTIEDFISSVVPVEITVENLSGFVDLKTLQQISRDIETSGQSIFSYEGRKCVIQPDPGKEGALLLSTANRISRFLQLGFSLDTDDSVVLSDDDISRIRTGDTVVKQDEVAYGFDLNKGRICRLQKGRALITKIERGHHR